MSRKSREYLRRVCLGKNEKVSTFIWDIWTVASLLWITSHEDIVNEITQDFEHDNVFKVAPHPVYDKAITVLTPDQHKAKHESEIQDLK